MLWLVYDLMIMLLVVGCYMYRCQSIARGSVVTKVRLDCVVKKQRRQMLWFCVSVCLVEVDWLVGCLVG